MRKFPIKRKFLPLFLGLLLLGLLIGVMIPFASSATPAGNKITDLYLLAPYANESVTDNKGNLRFAFSVDSTGYAEYGIVYSNTVESPVVGVDDCQINNYKINGFQNSMDADHPAASGRKWVLFKIGNIWHTEHDTPYYVRAYVKDSSGKYYYSRDVICTTVCRMFGHAHTVPNPTSTTPVTSLTEPGTRVGHCSVCNRDNKTEYVSPSVTTATFTSSSSGTYVKKTNIYTTLLENGAKHFYPHSSNSNKGNDLLIEFSFLWNKSLADLNRAYMGIGRIANSGGGDSANLFYLNFANNVTDMWVPYAGGFEGGTYLNVDYGKEGLVINHPARNQCAFIGEYGWHRIGVRVHEDAWIEKIDNGNNTTTSVVKYRMTAMLYLDGQPISQLSKEYDASEADSNLLFTATVTSNDTLQYTDIPNGRYVYGFRLENKKAKSGKTVEFSYADYSVTCGREFQKKVEFNYPLYNLNANYPAGVYYKPITHETMPSGDFKLPAVDPTTHKMYLPEYGQHPRLLFTEAELPAIRTTFNADTTGRKQHILDLAALYATENDTFTLPSNDTVTWDGHTYQKQDPEVIKYVLSIIEAKAFLYQVQGNEQYALQAIRLIKQFLNDVEDIDDGNKCRVFGEGMFVTALVYDWCYDLLSPSDKATLIKGVQDNLCKPLAANPSTSPWSNEQFRMEVGFPPSGDQLNEGAISDHGCERQILRDYLSFAIAIFDQDRSWYDYVAGRLYQEYVPVRNYLYESDYAPQGISNYLDMRFGSDIWSAWLLKTATGVLPYDNDHMKQVMHTTYAHATDVAYTGGDVGTTIFSMGDDATHDEWQHSSGLARLNAMALSGMISGYLFNDPIPMRWASYSNYADVHAPYYMILRSTNVNQDASRRFEGLSLITYNGGFLGQMIAHDKWNDEASASVFMKIGCRTTSGHDHADSGSFQIWYKGLLAGDAGVYDDYNSEHWANYHQATIAHNSIVLMRGTDTNYTVLQQKQPGETRNFNNGSGSWLQSDYYKTGEVTGHASGYKNGKPAYAYIAGDIADAYSSNDLTRCDRRMLAVFDTDTEDVPLFFFVFDYVVSKNASDKKAFLIHTLAEPTIYDSTNSAILKGGSGKLVVQPILCGSGSATITKVQCNAANDYNVGGTTHPTTAGSYTDGYWGWLQISPDTNEKYTPMLTVMFATSRNNSKSAATHPAHHFSNSKIQGAAIENTVAVFVTQEDPIAESVGFYTTGVPSGNKNYYVSNVAKGTWVVHSSDGTQTLTTTEEEHFLTFTAPTGTIVLEYVGPNIGQN